MAELSPANDNAKDTQVVQPVDQKQTDGANTDNTDDKSGNKGDLNVALSQERAEKATLKAEKEALELKTRELENRLKDAKLDTLSDDERADAEFREITVEKVLTQLDKEALKNVPEGLRNRIIKDPWALMSQEDLDRRTRFTQGKGQFYKEAEKAAVESLNEFLKDFAPDKATQEQKKDENDPSLSPGNDKGNDAIGDYTEAQLLKMRFGTPEERAKFDKIRLAKR